MISVLLLSALLAFAKISQAQPALIIDVGNSGLGVYPPSGDSVVVWVYLQNVVDEVGAFDIWLSLDHNEVFIWDTISTPGSAIEDWELDEVTVIGSQFHVIAEIGTAGEAPIPTGQHLLMKLVARVRGDRLDPDGTVVDSMCDDPYYELWGETVVHIDSALFWTEDTTELIGWEWQVFCTDSSCTEWYGDSCVAWECTEWDSAFVCDSSEFYFYDGLINLDCELLDYICGDADRSETIDIDDVVYLVAYIFSGGPQPYQYYSGDTDCSGWVDVDDVVHLIGYIFSGGPVPCDTDGDGIPDC